MAQAKQTRPSNQPLGAELRERAIRLVNETVEQEGSSYGVVARIARDLGISSETLHAWMRRSGRDLRRQSGAPPDAQARISQLERENRELRRANEILKAASTFFAAELDRHEPR
jgi:transposase